MIPSVYLSEMTALFDEIAEFLASQPTLTAITQFRLSEASEHFVSRLLEANRTGSLTPEERAALEEYSRVERLMQAVKIRAFAKLAQTKSLGVII